MYIDTQILIAAFIKESEHHKKAREIISKAKEIKMSIVSLLELYYVLLYKLKLDFNDVFKYIEFLLLNPKVKIVSPSKNEIYMALQILKREKINPRRFSDKIILAQSIRDGLLTFDKELKKEHEIYREED